MASFIFVCCLSYFFSPFMTLRLTSSVLFSNFLISHTEVWPHSGVEYLRYLRPLECVGGPMESKRTKLVKYVVIVSFDNG